MIRGRIMCILQVSSEFNADQAACKHCYNDARALARVAKAQGLESELEKMQAESGEKEYRALFKAYSKAREKSRRDGSKLKFNIATFRIEHKSRSGSLREAIGEMMWEGEYYEFAKTAKAGFLSEAEMKENWQRWLRDESVPRDNNGPRNYLRLFVLCNGAIARP